MWTESPQQKATHCGRLVSCHHGPDATGWSAEADLELALKLHNFARRTCIERHAHWAAIYSQIARDGRDRTGFNYTDEAYASFPRYNVLAAVLDCIEQLEPTTLPDVESLRLTLIEAATRASSAFTTPNTNEVHNRAIAEERSTLAGIFREVTEAELTQVEPLFYRRVLTESEVRDWRSTILERWGAGEVYWYPLAPKSEPSLLALHVPMVADSLPRRLQHFFLERNVERVVELREFGASYEIQADAVAIEYTGAEGFWTSAGNDWIAYCSHEGTITLGGSLAHGLERHFPGAKVEWADAGTLA